MRQRLLIIGLAASLAAPSLARASDACGQQAHDRRVAGTAIGAVGGALVGQALSHNTAGTLLGGAGGAVVGNQVARTSCDRPHYASHSRTHAVRHEDNNANAAAAGCHYENRPYYDERGQLVYHPTQVCR
jgi:osmotically inducible lipoprotein OsmB